MLASQLTGKLVRRRQASTQLNDSPTSKGTSRRKNPGPPAVEGTTAPLQPSFALRSRPVPRRASTDLTSVPWDSFPACDDLSDDSDLIPPGADDPHPGDRVVTLKDTPRTVPG